jgi:hypothetical protein
MKRFNFKAQLKGMNLEQLNSLKETHLDWMLNFLAIPTEQAQKEADKQHRYIGYIDQAISKLN